jgi:hypothetical protein
MESSVAAPRATPRTACPDCGAPLRPIWLIDHSNEPDRELEYTSSDAWQRWIFGRYPVAGTVRGRVCACGGRIMFFAEPRGEAGGRVVEAFPTRREPRAGSGVTDLVLLLAFGLLALVACLDLSSGAEAVAQRAWFILAIGCAGLIVTGSQILPLWRSLLAPTGRP